MKKRKNNADDLPPPRRLVGLLPHCQTSDLTRDLTDHGGDNISYPVVLTLTRIIKSVVTGQAPVTLELRNTPEKKHKTNQRWHTHISQLTQFMPPTETYKSEIGSQPTMCQVHTGAYVSLLAPGETDYTASHQERLPRIYCT